MAGDDIDDADALLVAAGEKGGAGRAADGAIGMEIGEGESAGCHAFEVRGFYPAIAVDRGISVAEVVGHDDDNVRRVGVGDADCQKEKQ